MLVELKFIVFRAMKSNFDPQFSGLYRAKSHLIGFRIALEDLMVSEIQAYALLFQLE